MNTNSESKLAEIQKKIHLYSNLVAMLESNIREKKDIQEFHMECNDFLMSNLDMPQLQMVQDFHNSMKNKRIKNEKVANRVPIKSTLS